MTRRYVTKAIRVLDSNGQACIAYREVTPIEEYGKWIWDILSVAILVVALTATIFAVILLNS